MSRASGKTTKRKAPSAVATVSRTYQEFDWYESPTYYDAIFDVDSDLEANFLEQAFELHATPPPKSRSQRRVLEPACGSGRLLVELAQRGWKAHGFDLEPAMVEFSKNRLRAGGLNGTVVQGNMADFKTRGRFDLAHCLVSTFKYLLTEQDARGHLQSVAQALRAGGIYALGFHLSHYGDEKKTRERWKVEKHGAQIDCTITSWPADPKTRLEKIQARLKVMEAGAEKRAQTNWSFRSYNVRQVRSLLRSVPELEHVGTYDFHYQIDEPQKFSDDQFDTLLILRRR